jgi:PRTRC genetic system protein E
MIKQILQIAKSCVSLNILAVATADGGLSLTFIPKLKDGADPLMATPVTLKGTPEELEEGLAAALDTIHSKRQTLAETVEAAQAVLAQATKDAAEKATAKKAVKAKPATTSKPVTSDQSDNTEDEDEDSDGDGSADASDAQSPTAATSAASTSTAPAVAKLNLFA